MDRPSVHAPGAAAQDHSSGWGLGPAGPGGRLHAPVRSCLFLLGLGSTLLLSAGAAVPTRALNYELLPGGGAYGIALDAESDAWVARPEANRIDRIRVKENPLRRKQELKPFSLPSKLFQRPTYLTVELRSGASSRIWFTDPLTRRIGNLVLNGSREVERIDRDDADTRDAVPPGLIPGAIQFVPGRGIVCALNSDGSVPSQILIFQPAEDGTIPASPTRVALGDGVHVRAFAVEAAGAGQRLFFTTNAHSIGWIYLDEPDQVAGTLSLNIQDLFEPAGLAVGPRLADAPAGAESALWVTAGRNVGVIHLFPASQGAKPRVARVRRLPFAGGPVASTGVDPKDDVVLIGSASPANGVLRLTSDFKRRIFHGRGRSPVAALARDPKRSGDFWFTQPYVDEVGRLSPPLRD